MLAMPTVRFDSATLLKRCAEEAASLFYFVAGRKLDETMGNKYPQTRLRGLFPAEAPPRGASGPKSFNLGQLSRRRGLDRLPFFWTLLFLSACPEDVEGEKKEIKSSQKRSGL